MVSLISDITSPTVIIFMLPHAHVRSRDKAMPLCLWVSSQKKNIEKHFKKVAKAVKDIMLNDK